MIILNTENSIEKEKNGSFNKTQSETSKIFAYSIPYESEKNSQFKEKQYKPLINVQEIYDDKKYYDINYSNMKCLSSL